MTKRIQVTLDTGSIDSAIKELKAYSVSLEEKNEAFKWRVANYIKHLAQNGYNNSTLDIALDGTKIFADVTVDIVPDRDKTLVIANGTDAVFVEFGAGVHFNGAVGSSPNPHGKELGLTIGSFGKGKGRLDSWTYHDDETDEFVTTYGTSATMPLTKAVMLIRGDLCQIAREVFKST